MYFDKYKMVVQADGDPGDSAMETCFNGICKYLDGTFVSKKASHNIYLRVSELCIEDKFPWRIRRSPDPKYWSREWCHGTGDQWQNFIVLAGLHRDYKMLLKLLLSFSIRGFFCTNTRRRNVYPTMDEHYKKSPYWRPWEPGFNLPDFRPGFLFLFIRGFAPYSVLLYPLLIFSDLGLLFGSITKCFNIGRKVKAGNDGNYFIKSIYSKVRYSTPVAWLSRYLYFHYRSDL